MAYLRSKLKCPPTAPYRVPLPIKTEKLYCYLSPNNPGTLILIGPRGAPRVLSLLAVTGEDSATKVQVGEAWRGAKTATPVATVCGRELSSTAFAQACTNGMRWIRRLEGVQLKNPQLVVSFSTRVYSLRNANRVSGISWHSCILNPKP